MQKMVVERLVAAGGAGMRHALCLCLTCTRARPSPSHIHTNTGATAAARARRLAPARISPLRTKACTSSRHRRPPGVPNPGAHCSTRPSPTASLASPSGCSPERLGLCDALRIQSGDRVFLPRHTSYSPLSRCAEGRTLEMGTPSKRPSLLLSRRPCFLASLGRKLAHWPDLQAWIRGSGG
jgi:hypothetical protein